MIPSNFHTHTYRCQHAYGTDEEYVKEAISIGMKELGFSDHCPIPFKSDYVSHIRMTMDQFMGYTKSIRTLAKKYASDIKIYLGLEMEYIPQYFNEQISFFDSIGIDYLILGEHFIDDEENGTYSGQATTDQDFLKKYVDTVLEGLSTGRFEYLAHPDLINFKGDSHIYEKEITRLCQGVKALNLPLELNALGLYTNRHYPNDKFWDIASKVNCKAIVGMDAHIPEFLSQQPIYDQAVAYIQSKKMEQVFLHL